MSEMDREPPPPYFPPPPPTFQSSAITYNSGSSRTPTGFQSLPTVIQFRILQYYVDGIGGRRTGIGHGRNGGIREDDSPGKMERLVRLMDLRRCCRVMYLLSMNVLRTHYLKPYLKSIKPPNTSSPFPSSTSTSTSPPSPSPSSTLTSSHNAGNVFLTRSRETAVFDLFICKRLGGDLRREESELFEDCEEGDWDLFGRMQPQARLEDILFSALSPGLINHPSSPNTHPLLPLGSPLVPPLPSHALSVTLTPSKAELRMRHQGSGTGVVCVVERRKGGGLEEVGEDLGRVMRVSMGLEW